MSTRPAGTSCTKTTSLPFLVLTQLSCGPVTIKRMRKMTKCYQNARVLVRNWTRQATDDDDAVTWCSMDGHRSPINLVSTRHGISERATADTLHGRHRWSCRPRTLLGPTPHPQPPQKRKTERNKKLAPKKKKRKEKRKTEREK